MTTAAMPVPEKIEVLQKARELLQTGWGKFSFKTPFQAEDGAVHQRYCVMGAIFEVMGGVPAARGSDVVETVKRCSLATAVYNALPEPPALPNIGDTYQRGGCECEWCTVTADDPLEAALEFVYAYNDEDGRTQEDMLAFVDRAIDLLKQGEVAA